MLSGKYFSLYILNCLFFFKSTTVYGIDPFTASATSAAFAYLLGYYGKSYDFFKCPKSSLDIEKLKLALEENFFGQHIATHIVLSALEGNLHRSKNNKKPLVMCFQGTTGSGKNYLSELIADHMFDSEKVKMKQFHVIHGRSYFVDESKIDSKREELYTYVKSKIESCDTNVFVFDEVDSIPMGALDILISIFENNEVSVDSRNSIFIFLTNAGADAIERKCLEFLENGNYRESMNIQDFDTILLQSAFNYKGALKKSEIIDSGVIDLYVPFLPLESVHVSKCIKAEVKNLKQDLDSKKIRRILKILFIPGSKNVFSSSGCKRIKQLVTLEFKPY